MTRSDLFSLSIMPSKSIHAVANEKISFFRMAKQYYIGCVCIYVHIYIYTHTHTYIYIYKNHFDSFVIDEVSGVASMSLLL